ncbi:MAG: PilW family protein [Gammaproteobacteria bacterium]
MKTLSHALRDQKGLSLVELMVAIAIGLFLLAGAISIFTNSKRVYVEQEDMSRIQENLRYAMDTISHDLRSAGYFGCGYAIDSSKLNNTLGAASGTLLDTKAGGLEGMEGSAGTKQWLPSGNTSEVIGSTTGSADAITIRHAAGPTWEVTDDFAANEAVDVKNVTSAYTADTTYLSLNANVVYGGTGSKIESNDLVTVGACGNVDLFKAGTTTTTSVAHTATFSTGYDKYARVNKATFVRYYIGTDGTTGEPALYRQRWDRASNSTVTELLVPGIENMQITYGVDEDGDFAVDKFVPANTTDFTDGTADNWTKVIAVRIGLLARSATANAPETDSQTYTLNGTSISAANDHRKRRAIEATVFIRNNSVNSDKA